MDGMTVSLGRVMSPLGVTGSGNGVEPQAATRPASARQTRSLLRLRIPEF